MINAQILAAQGQSMQGILMIGLMVIIFYFFMIRPQTKKQKELKKFREGLKVGDKIVSIGGIHGKILEVTDSTVLIQSEGTKLRLEKSAVSQAMEDTLQAK
ncbi:MAG: preprotein translocase subunit YajC [Flavobacteriales bacterium]